MAATKKLEFHEAANIFPLMEGDDKEKFRASIKELGQQVPIQRLKGKIIDGRNRYVICLEEKIDPWIIEADLGDLTPLQFVLAHNQDRRHLTASQRSMVAARARELFDADAKERQKASGGDKKSEIPEEKSVVENLPQPILGQKSRDAAGAALQVSGKSVDAATKVIEKGTPELAKAVDDGTIAVSRAAKLADKPEAEQQQAVSEAAARKPSKKPTKSNRDHAQAGIKALGQLVRALDAIGVYEKHRDDLTKIQKRLEAVR